MIGVDITDLSRVKDDEAFIRRVLTPEEQAELADRKTASRRIEYIGGRFAAKEALFKATGWKDCLSCSVLNDGYGKPYIKDHPELSVSISHDGGMAIAVVQAP
jgi:holo-[acyl-carrier protein] synthase